MYKIKQESEHHYEIQTPEGASFHVAKAGLTPKMHENIKKMCEGGMAHYAEGTADAEPEDTQDPTGGAEEAVQPAVAPDVNAAPVAQGPSVGGPTPDLNTPIDPNTAAQYQQSFQEEKLAGQQGAQAKQQLSKDTGSALDKQVSSAQDLYDHFQTQEFNRMQKQDELATDVANSKIDPKVYFNNLSTLGKAGTIFGLVLGGLGAGASGGVNQAVTALNQNIQRDVDAQKANQGNLNNLWQKNFEQTQDARQADILSQSQQLSITNQQLASIAAKNGTPQAQAAYTQLDAGIKQQQANLSQQLGLLQLRNHIDTAGPVDAKLAPFARDPKSMVALGNGTVVHSTNPVEASKIIATHQPAINSLQELSQLDASAFKPTSPNYQKALALTSRLTNQLKEASGGGRETEEYLKRIKGLFNNPTDVVDEFLHGDKTRETLKGLRQQRDTKLSPYIPSLRTRQSFSEQPGPGNGQ